MFPLDSLRGDVPSVAEVAMHGDHPAIGSLVMKRVGLHVHVVIGALYLGAACILVAEWVLVKLGTHCRVETVIAGYVMRAASRLVLDVVAAGCLDRRLSSMHESLWMMLLEEYRRSV
jgi:hypothetical protein